MKQWYKSKVFAGEKLGQKLGFPTVNLNPKALPKNLKEGVYCCIVKYKDEQHNGALYYGPRLVLKETKKVLEIYILNFNKEIYGETIYWRPTSFIRAPKNFSSLEKMQEQLRQDVSSITH
ncbi:MAG: riboflavin kinase [Patescibacteria group bacterium]|nr:riboflavin kinase [Patescibacteria group bacterium]